MTHDHAADVGVAVAVVSGLVTDRLAGHAIALATAIPHDAVGPLVTVLVGATLRLVDSALRRREARAAADDAERIARASVPAGPPRALVVDDDETAHLIAAHAAEAIGCTVEHASTARAALGALARDRGIRLVLLDLRLPDSGPSLAWAREIRAAAHPDARVIVVSGVDGAGDAAASIGAAVLLKPHSIDTLADAMRAALST